MRFGSLFAGVGGFDLGLEAAGWECGFQVEWDAHCQQVLAHHWPDVPRWGDVQEVNGADLPPVDVITFGSPCQDLSVAGKRAGLSGGRSGLFFEATRIIREMRDATRGTFPRYAIWENVVGALSSNNGDDFEAVIQEMVDCGGCHIEWSVLDAQFFGVPQRRRRVFVVACFDSAILSRSGRQIFAVSEGRARNPAKGKQQGKDPAGTVAAGFGNSGFERWAEREAAVTISQRDYKFPNNVVVEPTPYTSPNFAGYTEGVGTLRSSGGDLGGGSETLIVDFTHDSEVRTYAETTSTLQARIGTGGNQIPCAFYEGEPMQVRRLTPIECERLMGWPDNHTLFRADGKTNSDSTRYKMCGNGVASPVAKWIAEQINIVDTGDC